MAWYSNLGNKLKKAQAIGKKITGVTKVWGRKIQHGALNVADKLEAANIAPTAQALLRGTANVAGTAAQISQKLDENNVAGAARSLGNFVG